MSLAKRTGLPSFLRFKEGAYFEVKATAFNVFNNLNLVPFGFFSPTIETGQNSTNPFDRNFGRASGALAGRVIEFQGRINF
jgi:hypothetical protein